jgi:hypothetical protein
MNEVIVFVIPVTAINLRYTLCLYQFHCIIRLTLEAMKVQAPHPLGNLEQSRETGNNHAKNRWPSDYQMHSC